MTKELVKIFGRYYRENDRGRRQWIANKGRRSNQTGARYLSEYLKEYHNVDVPPSASEVYEGPPPEGGSAIAAAMEGLDSETDVALLRKKVVRLARASLVPSISSVTGIELTASSLSLSLFFSWLRALRCSVILSIR